MSVTLAIVVGVAMGIVFGFALEKSRVFEPGMIVGQMQLRNFIMLKVFLTAVATGAVVLAALNGYGYVKLAPKAALYSATSSAGSFSAPASRSPALVPARRWRKSAPAIGMRSSLCLADCSAPSLTFMRSPCCPRRFSRKAAARSFSPI
jgi:hypothetical protein